MGEKDFGRGNVGFLSPLSERGTGTIEKIGDQVRQNGRDIDALKEQLEGISSDLSRIMEIVSLKECVKEKRDATDETEIIKNIGDIVLRQSIKIEANNQLLTLISEFLCSADSPLKSELSEKLRIVQEEAMDLDKEVDSLIDEGTIKSDIITLACTSCFKTYQINRVADITGLCTSCTVAKKERDKESESKESGVADIMFNLMTTGKAGGDKDDDRKRNNEL